MGLTDTPVPLPSGATATTAASGGNREELLGPRPARMRAAAKQTLGAATRAPYQDKIILSFANSPPLAIWNFASRSETCRFFFSSPETS